MQSKAERLGKPVREAGEGSEHHAADDDVVKMRDQKQAVVQQKVGRGDGEKHAGHAADHEGHEKSHRPQHRGGESDAAAVHREHPIVDLHAGAHRDDAGGDAEKGVDVRACPHREEVVQPDHERDQADEHGRCDHRAIVEQRLAGKRGDHLGEDAECRQDEDVDFRVPPGPDQVDEHHHVAAGIIREEMKAQIPVEGEHPERGGENGKRRHDQQVGGERGPAEHGHAQVAHAGRADLEDRGHEIDAGHQRADAGDQQRPQVVIHTDPGRVAELR